MSKIFRVFLVVLVAVLALAVPAVALAATFEEGTTGGPSGLAQGVGILILAAGAVLFLPIVQTRARTRAYGQQHHSGRVSIVDTWLSQYLKMAPRFARSVLVLLAVLATATALTMITSLEPWLSLLAVFAFTTLAICGYALVPKVDAEKWRWTVVLLGTVTVLIAAVSLLKLPIATGLILTFLIGAFLMGITSTLARKIEPSQHDYQYSTPPRQQLDLGRVGT